MIVHCILFHAAFNGFVMLTRGAADALGGVALTRFKMSVYVCTYIDLFLNVLDCELLNINCLHISTTIKQNGPVVLACEIRLFDCITLDFYISILYLLI